MNLFSVEELRMLVGERANPCLSIFLPTHRAGADRQQDPIRYKNLLREAEDTLLDRGMRRPDVGKLLAPAHELLKDGLFWQHQREGLAVFISPSPGMFHHYRVPIRLEAGVVIANQFHTKPLLPLLSGDGQFYVLALSQNEIRLLEGTRFTVSEIELEDIPQRLAEMLRPENLERQVQFHTSTPQGGQRAAMFHGHGGGDEESKERLVRFFQRVDDALREILNEKRIPLVLAGVDYLLPLYQRANTYGYLAEEGIPGNPETLTPDDLHARAWAIVEPIFQRAQAEARERFSSLLATGQASHQLPEVVPAAAYGRVETLFVAVGHPEWGSFDPDTGRIELHQSARPDSISLLDLAATQTILNGGVVYAVPPAEIPGGSTVAAVFRY